MDIEMVFEMIEEALIQADDYRQLREDLRDIRQSILDALDGKCISCGEPIEPGTAHEPAEAN